MNATLFAMAAGFTASALCVRQFPAVAAATGLALFFGAGLAGVGLILRSLGCPVAVADTVAAFCPLRTWIAADKGPRLLGDYWFSLSAVAGGSFALLAIAVWRVGRIWRDRAKRASRWSQFEGGCFASRGTASRTAFRRRLLEINPLFWLAGSQRVSAPIFMLLTVGLVALTAGFTAPYFGRVIRAGAISPMLGHLFAWLWAGLAIHALVLYYGAMAASQRLAEDKQNGALELILSTPTSERAISRGLWMAYGRRMVFPALVGLLVHLFFLWQFLALVVLDPPGKLPPQFTPLGLLWSALLDQPLNGLRLDWEIVSMFRILLLVLVALVANWFMLGWLGRWLGLKMKHPGFAPITSVFLALAPPTLLFSLLCYLFDRWHLTRMPDRQLVPIMMWIGFGISLGNCLLLSVWAAVRLRRDFRTTVTSRYEPPSQHRWRIPSRRALVRFGAAATASMLALVLIIVLYYSHQNSQSRRRWSAFQKELKQRGESLDLSAVMPGPVPAAQNFAQAPAFRNFLDRNRGTNLPVRLLDRSPDYSVQPGPANNALTPWTQQRAADFDEPLKWIDPEFSPSAVKDRTTSASAMREGLNPLREDLAAVALAAQLPFFHAAPDRSPVAVFQFNTRELVTLQRLHAVFVLRASVLLALNCETEAATDVLTSLRLAQLARQSPDVNACSRVQVLLARSLQPAWEGLAEHRWDETRLAAVQNALARFDLLSDHTNAIRRIVLAHMETWRSIPESKTLSLPQAGGGYARRGDWSWQPRGWWYDNCRQLYQAGQNAVTRVDVASGRVSNEVNWSELSGLPIDASTGQMLQQTAWWGSDPTQVAFAQTAVNQAIIACALERYRLAHGALPETLEQLLPVYLENIPRDLNCGRPMFYQRDDKNGYVLRGVGPNGAIDHGKVASDDWVWSFTTPATNTPAGGIPRK